MLSINEQNYFNVFGISCVENHVLAIMNALNLDISYIYSFSLVTLKQLYTYFYIKNKNYEFFDEIPKAQDILINEGFLELEYLDPVYVDDAYQIFHEENCYVLLQLKHEYQVSYFNKKPLRSDHFVMSEIRKNSIMIINDIPLSLREISHAEFNNAFYNKIIKLHLLNNHNNLYLNTYDWCKNYLKEDTDLSNFNLLLSNGTKLRDLVGIYTLCLRRISVYLQTKFKIFHIQDYIELLSKIHMNITYLILRKKLTNEEIKNIWNRLIKIENEVINCIKNIRG